jgi:VWFA-related protein
VICIDTLHTSFANTTAIRDALTRLLEKEKPNGTQFSVVAIGRKLQVVQTVTTDPAAAVARLRGGSFRNVMSGDEASLASELNDLKNSMYDFCRRCPACGAGANSATCATQVQSLKLTLDGQAERWGSFTKQMLAQLKAVVEELTKLSSTRTLVLVSDGFSLQPARDFYSVAAAFLPAARQFKTSGPDDLEAEVQAITRAALAGNVRIYSLASNGNSQPSFSAGGSMDASSPSDRSAPSVIRHVPSANRGGGLLSDMDREASANVFQNSSALSQLAQTTGGEFLHGSNDTLKQFQSILADGREYYMLAYVPKNSAQDGAFRSIAVQVKGGKNLQVRAKAGYWPKTPQAN